jgi:hypothetical protein
MLGDKERKVLNMGLQKYRSGQSEPISIGGEKLLKPALQLMNVYRLRIDEIKGDAVVTSYTRWLEAVQVIGTENQQVYMTFSPRFEHIWLESKKRLWEYVDQNPANIGLRSQYSIRLYGWAKKFMAREKLAPSTASLSCTRRKLTRHPGRSNKVHWHTPVLVKVRDAKRNLSHRGNLAKHEGLRRHNHQR